MSDYGPPPGPPAPSGPPPGGPAASSTGAHSAAVPDGSAASAQQVTMLSYAAAALGLLSFVWGFLDWFGGGGFSASGYSAVGGPAGAIIGLALVAGLLAAAATVEKRDVGIAPAAIAVAGLLVAFGVLVGHGDAGGASDTKIGLILAFITAIVQAAALIVAWLLATERMPAVGGRSSDAPSNQWQSGPGPQGYPGGQGYAGAPGYSGAPGNPGPQGPQGAPDSPGSAGPGQFGGYSGEQQGQFGPPPGYGPPPQDPSSGYGPPPGPPPGYGPRPSQDQGSGFGPPQEQGPSYGPPPSQEQPPSYAPPRDPGPSYAPPSGAPSPAPSGYGPPSPPGEEDDASRTQVLPRFTGDQFGPEQNPGSGERSGEQEPPNYGR